MATLRAGDWIAAASAQAKACRAADGVQSTAGGGDVPYTPGTFALETVKFWRESALLVLQAARAEGKDISSDAVPVGDDGSAILARVNAIAAEGSSSVATRQSLTRVASSLMTMHGALATGSIPGTHNAAGTLCLSADSCARFWGAVKALSIEYSSLAAATSIHADEYWSAVEEGAKDGLRSVGEAAGATLSAVGEGAGEAVGGLFHGLGIVNTAIVLGGGYLVARQVF